MESESTRLTENKKESITNIVDMFINTNVIILKTVNPDLFKRETVKTRIFIL